MLTAWLFTSVLACASNGGGVVSACRSDTDCVDGSSCFEPGACNAGMEEVTPVACSDTEPCAGALVCETSAAGCGFSAGAVCVEPCPARPCSEDETCGDDGVCAPTACADGFTCPAHTHCAEAGDAHGCARDACAADSDCNAGHCVNGRCFDDLGECDWVAP